MNSQQMVELANTLKFEPKAFEKVLKLSELLQAIFEDNYLRSRLVLKGGTALNLFWLTLPRLSVDIDLNYIGSPKKEIAIEERPQIHQAIGQKAKVLGIKPIKNAKEYAGGKFKFQYLSYTGKEDLIALDINYIFRIPLFLVQEKVCCISSATKHLVNIPVLDFHEIAAGKISALLSRNASRDIFDLVEIFRSTSFIDMDKLAIAITIYLGASRNATEALKKEKFDIAPEEYNQKLFELLPINSPYKHSLDNLSRDFKEAFNQIPLLSHNQRKFIEMLELEGQIQPELVCDNKDIQEKIAMHPGLLWKVQNVLEYKKKNKF